MADEDCREESGGEGIGFEIVTRDFGDFGGDFKQTKLIGRL